MNVDEIKQFFYCEQIFEAIEENDEGKFVDSLIELGNLKLKEPLAIALEVVQGYKENLDKAYEVIKENDLVDKLEEKYFED